MLLPSLVENVENQWAFVNGNSLKKIHHSYGGKEPNASCNYIARSSVSSLLFNF